MVISVTVNPEFGGYSASISDHGTFQVLNIRDNARNTEIKVFGRAGDGDALKMMADVFNDAFQRAETPAPQGPPTLEDSDIPR